VPAELEQHPLLPGDCPVRRVRPRALDDGYRGRTRWADGAHDDVVEDVQVLVNIPACRLAAAALERFEDRPQRGRRADPPAPLKRDPARAGERAQRTATPAGRGAGPQAAGEEPGSDGRLRGQPCDAEPLDPYRAEQG
jgi:hypothetical protein